MGPQLKVAFSTPTEIFHNLPFFFHFFLPVPLYTFRHPYHPLTYLHKSSYILQQVEFPTTAASGDGSPRGDSPGILYSKKPYREVCLFKL